MKQTILALSLILLFSAAQAQTTAKEEIGRLATNVENAEYNLNQYEKNLKLVESNISSIEDAKAKVQKQAQNAASELKAYDEELLKFKKAKAQIAADQAKEKQEMLKEQQSIAQLRAQLKKLEDNQKVREENLKNYDQSLQVLNVEEQNWAQKRQELLALQKDINSQALEVKKQESSWVAKKRGYEGEVKRWSREVERQKDLHRTYSSLAEK